MSGRPSSSRRDPCSCRQRRSGWGRSAADRVSPQWRPRAAEDEWLTAGPADVAEFEEPPERNPRPLHGAQHSAVVRAHVPDLLAKALLAEGPVHRGAHESGKSLSAVERVAHHVVEVELAGAGMEPEPDLGNPGRRSGAPADMQRHSIA